MSGKDAAPASRDYVFLDGRWQHVGEVEKTASSPLTDVSLDEVQAELRRVERENTQLREKLSRWSAYLERQE